MVDFRSVICPVCKGKKVITIGRNIDDKKDETVDCPHCESKGVLYMDISLWSEKSKKRFDTNKMN
jgi:DNA-directed RNA polymerase subunit RPC12/RpoP